MIRILRAVLLATLVLLSHAALAHEMTMAEMELRETAAGQFMWQWTAVGNVPPGEWRAMKTKSGWRAMRLESISKPQPADFESLRGVVLHDWTDATLSEQRSAAVKALAQKYTVKTEAKAR